MHHHELWMVIINKYHPYLLTQDHTHFSLILHLDNDKEENVTCYF